MILREDNQAAADSHNAILRQLDYYYNFLDAQEKVESYQSSEIPRCRYFRSELHPGLTRTNARTEGVPLAREGFPRISCERPLIISIELDPGLTSRFS